MRRSGVVTAWTIALLAGLPLMTLQVREMCGQEPRVVVPPPTGVGSVTGRVTCGDTNGPARFASVVLVPVVGPPSQRSREKTDSPPRGPVSHVVRTALDGRFALTGVKPGDYYVISDAPGYRSAAGQLTREQMDKPTEAVAKLMSQMLVPVSVAANRASTVEVRLLRGASLSGTVRYDDGTPYGGAPITLYRKGEDAKWNQFNPHPLKGWATGGGDDKGAYRLSGLPAGEYRVATRLELQDIFTDSVFGGGGSWSNNGNYSVEVFYGGALRKDQAKIVKLTDGEDAADMEIEVPLSKMHTVEGRLIEAESGRRVNAGKVTLAYADDGTEMVSAEISGEDEAFRLLFVPEGDYIVKVTKAADVTREEISNGPGSLPPTHTDTKTVRSFGDVSQPLKVESEISGLLLSVPASKAAKGGAQ